MFRRATLRKLDLPSGPRIVRRPQVDAHTRRRSRAHPFFDEMVDAYCARNKGSNANQWMIGSDGPRGWG